MHASGLRVNIGLLRFQARTWRIISAPVQRTSYNSIGPFGPALRSDPYVLDTRLFFAIQQWTIFPLASGARSAISEAVVWRNEPHGQHQVVGPTRKLETFLTRKEETTEGYRAPRPLEVGTRTMHHDSLKLAEESRSPSMSTALMYRHYSHVISVLKNTLPFLSDPSSPSLSLSLSCRAKTKHFFALRLGRICAEAQCLLPQPLPVYCKRGRKCRGRPRRMRDLQGRLQAREVTASVNSRQWERLCSREWENRFAILCENLPPKLHLNRGHCILPRLLHPILPIRQAHATWGKDERLPWRHRRLFRRMKMQEYHWRTIPI